MFDINVILDILANREPFLDDSRSAFMRAIENDDEPFVAVHALSTLYYLLGSATTRKLRDAAMGWIFNSFKIAGAGEVEANAARAMKFRDFEDALVAACAVSSSCEVIVTRNLKDFRNSPIRAVHPREFQ